MLVCAGHVCNACVIVTDLPILYIEASVANLWPVDQIQSGKECRLTHEQILEYHNNYPACERHSTVFTNSGCGEVVLVVVDVVTWWGGVV